jgi:hypothetical protein
MKSLQNSNPLVTGLLAATFLLLLNLAFRIPSGEGFNPSDEGVVLAQSWRIMNGEIPHHDFITLRPAGSGFFHVIDFILPGNLIIASKWFTLIEYIFYSILISFLLVQILFPVKNRSFRNALTAGAGIWAALLNINHYNLFAWTTIDAVFWFSFALFGYYRYSLPGVRNRWLWVFTAVASAVVSALCRQTFALPAMVLMVAMLVRLLRNRDTLCLWAFGGGLMPGIACLLMLLFTGSVADFITQMTGRTEIWETGIVKYLHAFWHSPAFWIILPVILTILVRRWFEETGKKIVHLNTIIITQKYIIIAAIILSSILVYLMPEQLFSLSLLMFWLSIASILLVWAGSDGSTGLGITGWVLLIAWTSSVSTGDNAPVFTVGLLAVASLLLLIRHLPPVKLPRVVYSVAGVSLLVLSGLYIKAQKEYNYRDLPADQLIVEGKNLFRDLDGVKLNSSVGSYLADVKKIYEACGSPAGRFAVWPNNAIIYRFLDSPNPFSLDWMQKPEFAGSEPRLMTEVEEKLKTQDLFILVEKYNVKWIAREKIPLDEGAGDYPYLDILRKLYREVPSGSDWFSLFVRK